MIAQDTIQFGKTEINYDILYSDRRRNATLSVYPMKQIEITVPQDLEREHIQNLVRKKASWIIKQVLWFDEILQVDSQKEHVNGETYLYSGRQYRLKITNKQARPEAKLIGKYLEVALPENTPQNKQKKIIKVAIYDWYRKQAHKKVLDAVKDYSKKLGIEPPKFIIKNQYKRWGSCTKNNILNFNFRIAMAPASQINYVVAHELCHVLHKDHSVKFWKSLSTIMPDYEDRKEALRKEGWQYVL